MKKILSLVSVVALGMAVFAMPPSTNSEKSPNPVVSVEESSSTNISSRSGESGEWISRGTAIMTEGLFSLYPEYPQGEELEVEIEENSQKPGLYRLVNPYKNWSPVVNGQVEYDNSQDYYLTIDATDPNFVVLTTDFIGVKINGQVVKFGANAYNLIKIYGGNIDLIKTFYPGAGGVYKDGLFWFPISFLQGTQEYLSFNVTVGYITQAANGSGLFSIRLKDTELPDYSLNVPTIECPTGTTMKLSAEFGKDIASAKYSIVEGNKYGSGAYFLETISSGSEMESGKDYIYDVEPGKFYTVAVVGVDEDGHDRARHHEWVYVPTKDDSDWQSIGDVVYTDGILPMTYLTDQACEYTVTMEEKKSTPGYFRMVNPFANNPVVKGNGFLCNDNSHNHYLYINATKPEYTYIEVSSPGVDMGFGKLTVSSTVTSSITSGSTVEQLAAEGYTFAKYDTESHEIEFPVNTIYVAYPGRAFNSYLKNEKHTAKIKLPSSGIDDIVIDDEGDAVYYNMQGLKIENPSNGIFIRKIGKSAQVVKM